MFLYSAENDVSVLEALTFSMNRFSFSSLLLAGIGGYILVILIVTGPLLSPALLQVFIREAHEERLHLQVNCPERTPVDASSPTDTGSSQKLHSQLWCFRS